MTDVWCQIKKTSSTGNISIKYNDITEKKVLPMIFMLFLMLLHNIVMFEYCNNTDLCLHVRAFIYF